jgi:hypothetical protein
VEQPTDLAGQQAADAQRRRLRAMAGYASTQLTGGGGTLSAANIGKTSLGG